MSDNDLIIKKVWRIYYTSWRPYYVKVVVGYMYWNGLGIEVDLHGRPVEGPMFPKDSLGLTLKWILHGCHKHRQH